MATRLAHTVNAWESSAVHEWISSTYHPLFLVADAGLVPALAARCSCTLAPVHGAPPHNSEYRAPLRLSRPHHRRALGTPRGGSLIMALAEETVCKVMIGALGTVSLRLPRPRPR